MLGVSISMINTPTNYQSGAELHFEGALNEHFPFGLAAGVGGYKQLMPDGGSGDKRTMIRERTSAGIGAPRAEGWISGRRKKAIALPHGNAASQ